ncbi:MAG TPA: TRAP transporter permease [candidate division WOR-3 bacterium]|uniref:TRAP transporter permease n=1 Tax=candidate division WOR-3 bacterium TaxID=2052148 RepID=A0A9C9ELB7_UNCW3|nr:TRAP transporter permease [candidate division WOR-3 bacterium]
MRRTSKLELAKEILEEETGKLRTDKKSDRIVIAALSIGWALFQLALPRFIILDSITIRAVHLAFAVMLVFLTIPLLKRRGEIKFLNSKKYIPLLDYLLAVVACFTVLYIVLDWTGISMRAGIPGVRDIVMSILLIIIVFEASRRAIGIPLVLIAILFTIYSFVGPYLPSVFALRGVSLEKYLSQVALSTEGIYGIPLDVSANTVFLFVLLGAMLERAGAVHFFNDLAISLLGRFKGGPAKAAVVASGLTGLVSGSSIANVVTTGTFTIPLMKKVGYPAKVAAATEVAASTNGQLMPPIMGAAAFIIAEYLSIPYLDVVKAAAIPAFVSYFALFYLTHLEASKLGMKGLPESDIPDFTTVLKNGFYYLIPLFMLIYELMVLRHTPKLAAFNAIVVLMVIIFIRETTRALKNKKSVIYGIITSIKTIGNGFIAGSRNMLTVALATACAGIVVGIVTMGIGSLIVQIVEIISAGNIFLLLLITAVASLIIGMGLPTTATYIVMASITVPVIMTLSQKAGIGYIPAIAAHLFCFYFGILADDTPPVGLAAYSAAAIAKSDPIPTGIKGFSYDLRTAVIPFMFIFNSELVLFGINNFFQGFLIFAMAVFGAFAFSNAVQGWFLTKNRWYEIPFLLAASTLFFYPAVITRLFGLNYELRYFMYGFAFLIYGAVFFAQKTRLKK